MIYLTAAQAAAEKGLSGSRSGVYKACREGRLTCSQGQRGSHAGGKPELLIERDEKYEYWLKTTPRSVVTAATIERSRANGRKGGRPRSTTQTEAAALLGVNRDTVGAALADGRLTAAPADQATGKGGRREVRGVALDEKFDSFARVKPGRPKKGD